MQGEQAEIIALQALGWLAGNEELLPVFLGATGADGADLRARAGDAEFLASVLDFLLMDDQWVLECTSAIAEPPESLMRARMYLPGGDAVNWT